MIFDGKSLYDIKDEEINNLVQSHVTERQHLEFKVTINHKEDSERIELLRDIVSLANGGGGYIIVGIKDDGKGKAIKFEPDLVGNTEAIKKAIISLSHDHISERIEGMEVVTRVVKSNPLVIVRVPSSERIPHMSTYKNRTDFYTRYQDGKREMTMGEIREFFNKDKVNLRLSKIEKQLSKLSIGLKDEEMRKEIYTGVDSISDIELINIEDGKSLRNISLKNFENEVGNKPYFWIAATPQNPSHELFKVDEEKFRKLIKEPPGSRQNGWNIEDFYSDIERFGSGIRRGDKDNKYLIVLENGHMEFWTPLDGHFCWRQPPEEFKVRPRLYPYPVTEFPTTFLRLYRALVDLSKLDDSYYMTVCYKNLKGYILLPYSPNSNGFFYVDREIKPFEKKDIRIFRKDISSDFKPDLTAYSIIKRVYAYFGLEEKTIPFFNDEAKLFVFN